MKFAIPVIFCTNGNTKFVGQVTFFDAKRNCAQLISLHGVFGKFLKVVLA